MANVNKAIVMGVLGRDPEATTTGKCKVYCMPDENTGAAFNAWLSMPREFIYS